MEKSSSSDSELYKTLWKATDVLRSNMDAVEYKHVVLGLIFLKYISDSFSEKYRTLQNEKYADPEDKDEYIADNIFGYQVKLVGVIYKNMPSNQK